MNDIQTIQSKIYEIRGQRVMLDFDLAAMYGVETRALNQAVKRNIERFPEDFMFQLTKGEFEILRSQIVTSKVTAKQGVNDWTSQNVTSNFAKMGLRKQPYAFTELGVAMLSSVLRSETAIKVNRNIMKQSNTYPESSPQIHRAPLTKAAKPFIKWVGGKGQLIEQLDAQLPADFDNWEDVTYIEPFVGGGAMLFYMLQRYPNISHAVINDINPDLTTCYRTVRDNPEELITSLMDIQRTYNGLQTEDARKVFFLAARARYNEKNLDPIENTTKFFFLNRTCFNGLYRVNKNGFFNVPFGRYTNPQICDPATIRKDSKLLQHVEILTDDFEATFDYAHGNTLFYFDPPYRPLSDTSSFNDYAKEAFNDDAQIRLKEYCDRINDAGYHFMLSNSDCKGKNEEDNFFDVLYSAYNIERVWASRSINANPSKRGKLTEILVHNYAATKAHRNVRYEVPEVEPVYAAEENKDFV